MSSFTGRRFVRQQKITVEAPASEVFPFLCPKREEDWLVGWKHRMIHSDSGFAETGCVFLTDYPGEGPSFWVANRFDPIRFEVEYTRFVPNLAIMTLSFLLEKDSAESCTFDVNRAFIGLSDFGNLYAEKESASTPELAAFLERALNHYVKTGTMLVE